MNHLAGAMEEVVAQTLTEAAYYIGQVKTKLASGAYAVEPSTCICGGNGNATVVAERDRFGIPHRMVLCDSCGTIRADPRMTQEAYNQFYDEEYRPIYDGWQFGPHASDAQIFALKALEAQNFREFLDFFDCHPTTVFDVGSGGGELVACLREAGIDCIGVDLHPGKAGGEAGSIDTLAAAGKRADVIVLQQVLEHLLDPLGDVMRLRGLLNPGGLLFIGTPGLYVTNRHLLFQNAHVWQFTSDTLLYLMSRAGFEELYLDERMWSLWQVAEPHEIFPPADERRLALQYLQTGTRPLPVVKTINKFPLAKRKTHLTSALSRGLPDLSEIVDREAGRKALIIGGGPSIESYWAHIRLQQVSGARVVAIDRMNRWCLDHGITPDYVLTLDASDDVAPAFEALHAGTTHLVATQCPPAVFDRLTGQRVYIFQTPQRGIELGDFWNENNYERITILNAGGSVTIGCMAAAMALGMRDLDIFGFDCHVGGGWYAKGIHGVGASAGQTIQVRVEDRIFTTTYSYLSFAQQFHLLKALAEQHNRLDRIKIYGDSLATAMALDSDHLRGHDDEAYGSQEKHEDRHEASEAASE